MVKKRRKNFIVVAIVLVLMLVGGIYIVCCHNKKEQYIVNGKRNYESLQEAILDAESGDTIEFYQDIQVDDEISISGKKIVFSNAPGKAIMLSGECQISVGEDSVLTFNGCVDKNGVGELSLDENILVQNEGEIIVAGNFNGTFLVEACNTDAILSLDENWNFGKSNITMLPNEYVEGNLVINVNSEIMTPELLALIAVVPQSNDDLSVGWAVNEKGELQKAVAQNASTGSLFNDMSEAIETAENGDTIYILQSMILDHTIQLKGKSIVLANKGMTDISIYRKETLLTSMFTIDLDAQLQIGASGCGSLTIDGNEVETVGHSMVENSGTFILGKNGILKNGNAGAEEVSENVGGAIRNTGSVEIHGVLEANVAAFGGGIYNSGQLSVENATFTENHGWRHGGGIYNVGELSVHNSYFGFNMALFSFGGAICTYGGNTIIEDSTFECNRAKWNGGAVYARNKDTLLTFTGTNVFNDNINTAQNSATSYVHGFEISIREATIKLRNSVFSDEKDGETVVSLYHHGGNVIITGKVQGATLLYGEKGNTISTVAEDFDSANSHLIVRPFEDELGAQMITGESSELVEKASACIDVWSYSEDLFDAGEALYMIDEEGCLVFK